MAGLGFLFYISNAFSAHANLTNGRKQRELQEKIHDQDQAVAQARFGKDLALRREQFVWSQRQAEQLALTRRDERMQDFRHQHLRDKANRSFDRMRNYLRLSPDAWENDPSESANPGVQALRIIFQRPLKKPSHFYNKIEHAIAGAVRKYKALGADHPINFPTAAWIEAHEPGSFAADDLHLWNRTIPAVILRIKETGEENFFAEVDMFGFPMGRSVFERDVPLGEVDDNPEEISKLLSLAALAAADMHFLSSYTKMPLLPFMLPEFILPGEQPGPMIDDLVTSYRQTINGMLAGKPEIELNALLRLAEALTALPDEKHAIDQIQYIETITKNILPYNPELQDQLRNLYMAVGDSEKAARLPTTIVAPRKMITSAEARRAALEPHR